MFVVDEYLSKDVRKFFEPLFDYAVSEYIESDEKKLDSLGYKYVFYHDFETIPVGKLDKKMKEIADMINLEPDVDDFPIGAYDLMKSSKKLIIAGYGLNTLADLAEALNFEGEYLSFYRLVSKVDAGNVPVVHSHLLFNGSPHPLVDDVVFNKLKKLGFKPMVEDVDRSLLDYEIRFRKVFSDWSLLVKDLKKMADMVETRLDSEKGAREFYALSHLMDGELDIAKLWDRVGRVMELPPKPNLDILILRH